jgi:hypothetical protein
MVTALRFSRRIPFHFFRHEQVFFKYQTFCFLQPSRLAAAAISLVAPVTTTLRKRRRSLTYSFCCSPAKRLAPASVDDNAFTLLRDEVLNDCGKFSVYGICSI